MTELHANDPEVLSDEDFNIVDHDPKVILARQCMEVEDQIRHNPAIKTLLEAVFIDAVKALKAMVETEPEDVKQMTEYRNKYLRCRSIGRYLDTTIRAGHRIADEMQEEDAETGYE